MTLKFKKRVFNNIIIHLLITISILYIVNYITVFSEKNSKVIVLMTIVLYLWCIVSTKYTENKYITVYNIFITLLFIFTFGRVVLEWGFGYINDEVYRLDYIISNNDLLKACIFSIISITALHMGYLLFYVFNYKEVTIKNYNFTPYKKRAFLIMGWIIFLVALIPAISQLSNNILLALKGGYVSVYTTSNNIVGFQALITRLSEYFILGVLILILAYKKDTSKSKIFLIIGLSYCGISILLGARGIQILQAIIIIWVWNRAVKKISRRKFIMIIVCLVPIVSLFSIMQSLREMPLTNWIGELPNLIILELKDNPFLKVIYEIGVAIFPVAATIKIVPSVMSFSLGKSYLYSILMVIPNIFGESRHSAVALANVQEIIAKYWGIAFGGSIFQEFFFNFGWNSWIFMIILGVLLAKVFKVIEVTESPIILSLGTICCVQIFWSVRNGLFAIPRFIFMYFFLPYLLWRVILIYVYRKWR